MKGYDRIINLPHHVSEKHPQMPREDRAAQFAPFSALSGFDEAIRRAEKEAVQEKAIENIPKDGIMEKLEAAAGLSGVKPNAKLSVFSDGAVITEEGTVRKIDMNASVLVIDEGKRIPLKDILSLDLSAE